MPTDLRVLAHPLRLRILSLLTGAELSAADVARELGTTHANASYHLRRLHAAGELEVAGHARIRGGTAVRYRHPWREAAAPVPDAPGGRRRRRADPEADRLLARALGAELERRAGLRRPGTRSLVVDAEVWVEPEVWRQAAALVERAGALLHEHARPPRSRGTAPVTMTAALHALRDERPAVEVSGADA